MSTPLDSGPVRDPCQCPEHFALNPRRQFWLHAMCAPCAFWERGYVMVQGHVHYRAIVNDVLTIGKRVPATVLAKHQRPLRDPERHQAPTPQAS